MSSASFNSILALFCRIFKYKFGMVNKVVIKLSCVIGIKDINQSNRHYNAYWRGPNKFKIQCVILICYYYDNLQNYMKNE
ncbi:hypothetical protein DQV39_01855 [Staphylococcus aureus]|nr:hypothetical protein DQV98_01875 [Staphylococcus aureus]QFJ01565.1 hypothetical protein DQV40_01855 [Staphylococcus aureus]QFJ18824.1 hypothetical protein DQV03_01855 [Staphylococcus aureus]QFJ36213.1 hypothetical protein DQV39_01855 [Staphylococcus aureus]QFJ50736.1 hypothetical protein DQV62_01855 [Staphylococcus aureus]